MRRRAPPIVVLVLSGVGCGFNPTVLTSDAPKPGVGQAPDAEKYVEFVKGGKVVAKEVATVISADDMAKIAKSRRPAANSAKVETLKGNDYTRIWINKSGNNYLINLPTGS